MNWQESGLYKSYAYRSSEAIAIPKGARGKTEERLIGCFVPVIQYPSEVVLGHFGPKNQAVAQDKLRGLCKPSPALHVSLYRNELTRNSFWIVRADEYIQHFDQLLQIVAQAAHIGPADIAVLEYSMISEVIIDWTDGDQPNVYVQPAHHGL